MPKVVINPIQNLDNPSTAVARLDANFQALQTAIENTLSRDGTAPNAMVSNLDMNAFRILNLPVPVSATEPARHGDIQQYVDSAEDWALYAETQAIRAEVAAGFSEAFATEAENTLNDLKSRYLGSFATPPSVGWNGQPLVPGVIFFDTTLSRLSVYAIDSVVVGADDVVVGADRLIVSYWIPLPVATFEGLHDVDVSTANNGDWLVWTGLEVNPVAPTASNVQQTNVTYAGGTVQSALDDLITRTSLGIYDVYVYAQGLPGDNEELIRLVASRAFSLPVGAAGSSAIFRIAPSGGSVVFTILKNGVSVGTVTFADASTTGVFSVAGAETFGPGDVLSIKAPGSVNQAVRDLSVTLACTR